MSVNYINTVKYSLLGLALAIVSFACKKPFELPSGDIDTSILVVEGTIAVGDNAENIFKLSRLSTLQTSSAGIPENNASVTIISSGGSTWPLNQDISGVYKSTLNLPEGDSYKLQVQTAGGDQYESDLQTPVLTPEIDSITWKQPFDVSLFVHTHDATNSTRYYRWQFEETWEHNAWFEATLDFKNGSIVSRPIEDQVFTCWQSDSSKSIILGNSSSLANDVISYQPLLNISQANPLDRNKFSVRYSILVRQVGLSKAAYNFWNILKKNTELSGTLFDPQPSKLASNMHCLNDPSREVIGYISAGRIVSRRIFIKHSELAQWPTPDESEYCLLSSNSIAEAEATLAADKFLMPVTYVPRTNNSLVFITSASCMDCTLRGGVNVKPMYW